MFNAVAGLLYAQHEIATRARLSSRFRAPSHREALALTRAPYAHVVDHVVDPAKVALHGLHLEARGAAGAVAAWQHFMTERRAPTLDLRRVCVDYSVVSH